MEDKLISAKALMEAARDDGSISGVDVINLAKLVDKAPAIDPKARGQWMHYDLIQNTLRNQARGLRIEGRTEGADALEEMADYFNTISTMIGGDQT